ncbi:MAG: hypothetical protein E7231_01605 [Cellulosilyticum sp.]|jgi:hypothetical protein|nr:hypothetical protein [Cellulosilyticum sp.]
MEKTVADLTIYDSIGGLVEVLDMVIKNDKVVSLKVRWIVAALCYSCSYIPEENIDNLYFGEDIIDPKTIYEFHNIKTMPEDKINAMRAIDYVDQLNHTKRALKAA